MKDEHNSKINLCRGPKFLLTNTINIFKPVDKIANARHPKSYFREEKYFKLSIKLCSFERHRQQHTKKLIIIVNNPIIEAKKKEKQIYNPLTIFQQLGISERIMLQLGLIIYMVLILENLQINLLIFYQELQTKL